MRPQVHIEVGGDKTKKRGRERGLLLGMSNERRGGMTLLPETVPQECMLYLH
jgi:hypothetical protein